MNSLVSWLVDEWWRLVPAEVRANKDLAGRYLRVNALCLGYGVWVPLYVIIYLIDGAYGCALVLAVLGAFIITVPLIQRATESPTLAGQLGTGTAFCVFTIITYLSGGIHAPIYCWFVTVPIVASIMLGLRAGAYWTAMSAVVMTAYYLLQSAGVPMQQELSPEGYRLVTFLATVGLLMSGLLAIGIFDILMKRSMREVEAAHAAAEEANRALAVRMQELQEALDQVKTLQGILPICMYCKKIRNDQQYWQQVDTYLTEHTDVMLSHGICPVCYEKALADFTGQASGLNTKN